MIRNSLEALDYAIGQERDRSECAGEHALISITISVGYIANGMRHCSVNVECGAGCGWLIQTFGSEAEELEHKARMAQEVLSDSNNSIRNEEIATLLSTASTARTSVGNPASRVQPA